MSNPNISQRERSQNNPLNLGVFDRTTLRMLKGTLGPRSQIISGGYGRETYDHWFQVTLDSEAWIILFKSKSGLATGNTLPSANRSGLTSRFSIGVYDRNKNPIEGRGIFQADSKFSTDYLGHVMGAQSDLYNTFDPNRADKGYEQYFPLPKGKYLICISAERNEEFQYNVGLAVEFQAPSDRDWETNVLYKSL